MWQTWHHEIIWNFMFVFLTENHPNLLAYEETQPTHKALFFDMQRYHNREIKLGISARFFSPTNAPIY
jgi:hypothetical protein